jgi:cysteine synthase A
MPNSQSQEKKDMLRLFGAQLMEVAPAPYREPGNYVRVSEQVAKDLSETEDAGVLWANQWDNLANREAHIQGTGPEIWAQTAGRVDGFICAIGTGGSLAGVAAFLKSKNPKITVGLADPPGAAMFDYFTSGKLTSEGTSITEGIGQGRITRNVEGIPVDKAYRIPDAESVQVVFDLLHEEGLCIGGSAGVNVAGAIRLARELGPGHTVVTLLCDSGTRYQSKLFNPEFLRSRQLPVPAWLESHVQANS